MTLCEGWFDSDPHATTFLTRALFRELVALDWDDQQGPAASDYEPFDRDIRPRLEAILEALTNGQTVPVAELDALAVAVRDSHRLPPIIVPANPAP